MITIVNLHQRMLGEAVYIGRRMPPLVGSALANPFRMFAGYEPDRERAKVITLYTTWLDQQLANPDSPQSRELARLVDLARAGDLELACWCAPLACHGDVVKARIEERLS